MLRLIELREERVARGVDDGRPSRFAPGLPMIVLAAWIARAPTVSMPPVGDAATGVGERSA